MRESDKICGEYKNKNWDLISIRGTIFGESGDKKYGNRKLRIESK